MKRWYLTLILRRRLQQLRKPMDPGFAAALRVRLEKKAADVLVPKPVSVHSYKNPFMKKRTPYYASALALIAVLTTIFFPNLDPSAQEVIEKASANYENIGQDNMIYHEKRLDQHFSDETVVSESLEEIWINTETGETLSTSRDPENDMLLSAFGTSLQGDAYEFPSIEESADEGNPWIQTFWGDKTVCKVSQTQGNTVAVSILKIAEDDPSVNVTSGMKYDNDKNSENSLNEQLLSNSSLKNIRDVFKSFSGESDVELDYEKGSEGALNYYIFSQNFEFDDESGLHKGTIENYFNSTTFKLEKRKQYTEELPNEVDASTFLVVEEINAADATNIFDFEKYNMQLSQSISAEAPKNILEKEDGCYSSTGEKLSELSEQELFTQVGEEKINNWKSLLEGIANSEASPQPLEGFVQPTTGYITQGFHEGHNGIDIADGGAMPDVVAVADGVVIETGTGWSDGDGNNVWIDHGNGYKTHYAHLHEFSVQVGDTVKQGQIIGTMGKTGRVYGKTGIFLHFEVQLNGESLNPSSLLEIN